MGDWMFFLAQPFRARPVASGGDGSHYVGLFRVDTDGDDFYVVLSAKIVSLEHPDAARVGIPMQADESSEGHVRRLAGDNLLICFVAPADADPAHLACFSVPRPNFRTIPLAVMRVELGQWHPPGVPHYITYSLHHGVVLPLTQALEALLQTLRTHREGAAGLALQCLIARVPRDEPDVDYFCRLSQSILTPVGVASHGRTHTPSMIKFLEQCNATVVRGRVHLDALVRPGRSLEYTARGTTAEELITAIWDAERMLIASLRVRSMEPESLHQAREHALASFKGSQGAGLDPIERVHVSLRQRGLVQAIQVVDNGTGTHAAGAVAVGVARFIEDDADRHKQTFGVFSVDLGMPPYPTVISTGVGADTGPIACYRSLVEALAFTLEWQYKQARAKRLPTFEAWCNVLGYRVGRDWQLVATQAVERRFVNFVGTIGVPLAAGDENQYAWLARPCGAPAGAPPADGDVAHVKVALDKSVHVPPRTKDAVRRILAEGIFLHSTPESTLVERWEFGSRLVVHELMRLLPSLRARPGETLTDATDRITRLVGLHVPRGTPLDNTEIVASQIFVRTSREAALAQREIEARARGDALAREEVSGASKIQELPRKAAKKKKKDSTTTPELVDTPMRPAQVAPIEMVAPLDSTLPGEEHEASPVLADENAPAKAPPAAMQDGSKGDEDVTRTAIPWTPVAKKKTSTPGPRLPLEPLQEQVTATPITAQDADSSLLRAAVRTTHHEEEEELKQPPPVLPLLQGSSVELIASPTAAIMPLPAELVSKEEKRLARIARKAAAKEKKLEMSVVSSDPRSVPEPETLPLSEQLDASLQLAEATVPPPAAATPQGNVQVQTGGPMKIVLPPSEAEVMSQDDKRVAHARIARLLAANEELKQANAELDMRWRVSMEYAANLEKTIYHIEGEKRELTTSMNSLLRRYYHVLDILNPNTPF